MSAQQRMAEAVEAGAALRRAVDNLQPLLQFAVAADPALAAEAVDFRDTLMLTLQDLQIAVSLLLPGPPAQVNPNPPAGAQPAPDAPPQ